MIHFPRSVGATLLEKRRNMYEVQEALEAEKRKYAEKEDTFRVKEDTLKSQEHQLQISLVKFSKFNADNEQKRRRAKSKYADELAEIQIKDEEINLLKLEKDRLKKSGDKLVLSLQKYLKFADFLEAVKMCDGLPKGVDVKSRHDSLVRTSDELTMRNELLRSDLESVRNGHRNYLKQASNRELASTTEIAELQRELDVYEKKRQQLERRIAGATQISTSVSTRLDAVFDSVDNLFDRCRTRPILHHYAPGIFGSSGNNGKLSPLKTNASPRRSNSLKKTSDIDSPDKLLINKDKDQLGGFSSIVSDPTLDGIFSTTGSPRQQSAIEEIDEAYRNLGLVPPDISNGASIDPATQLPTNLSLSPNGFYDRNKKIEATMQATAANGSSPIPRIIADIMVRDEERCVKEQKQIIDSINPARAALRNAAKARRLGISPRELEARSKAASIEGLDPTDLVRLPDLDSQEICQKRFEAVVARLGCLRNYLTDFKAVVDIMDGKAQLPTGLLSPTQMQNLTDDGLDPLSILQPSNNSSSPAIYKSPITKSKKYSPSGSKEISDKTNRNLNTSVSPTQNRKNPSLDNNNRSHPLLNSSSHNLDQLSESGKVGYLKLDSSDGLSLQQLAEAAGLSGELGIGRLQDDTINGQGVLGIDVPVIVNRRQQEKLVKRRNQVLSNVSTTSKRKGLNSQAASQVSLNGNGSSRAPESRIED